MVDTFNEAYATKVIKDNATAPRELGNTRGARQYWTNTHGVRCGPTCSNDDDSRMLNSEVSAGVRMLWTNTRGNHRGPTCSSDDDSRMLTGSAEVPEVAGDARKLWRGWSSS
mmetsp:Transcript_27236/g.30596  ORF Transcript_27236/g.30596 Transcript_27236/m.30596 type:complete len:112 (+) Transcript_27236:180-515(+)